MDISLIVTDAMLVLNVAEKLLTLGMDAAPNIATAVSILKGETTLSAEERTALIATQTDLETKIDAEVAADDSSQT